MSTGSSPAKARLRPSLGKSPAEIKEAFDRLVDLRDLALLLEVSPSQLSYILWRIPKSQRYNKWTIKKRNGGKRRISAPTQSHRILQKKMVCILKIIGRVRPSAHGFVEGKSIVSNALMHVKQRFVLNIDLKDFFPSINFGRVRGLFMSKPYKVGERAATAIAQLCCNEDGLPQGAPTSPILSNLICAKLDAELTRLAQRYSIIYTRYADDLTFSTSRSRFPGEIASHDESNQTINLGGDLLHIIQTNGFQVNDTKTRLQMRNARMEVTGLIVNRRPNVDRKLVAQIRAMLHAWSKYGYDAAQTEFLAKYDNKHRPSQLSTRCFERVLRGKLAFLKQVRGGSNARYIKLQRLFEGLTGEVRTTAPVSDGDVMYDAFICHASEDKPEVVVPLTSAFQAAGINIWLDSGQIKWGDGITEAVNLGLSKSRFVIVVLSPSFLAKNWPEKEMNAVMAEEIKTGVKRALPLVVGGTSIKEAISKKYPLLSDKLYLDWSTSDLGHIVSALKSLIER